MAADSSNRGSAPQEKAGDTTRKLSPEMEILAKWLKEYKDHFWVINMENDRMRRISKVLREITKADDVFIFLMHPRRPSTLVQRGAFDADLSIFDGPSKDLESLKELVGKTNPMQDAKDLAWLRAVALGASCPLEGAYTEMALKMEGPKEKGISIQAARRQVLVTRENYASKLHLPEWPTGFETHKDLYRSLEDTVYVKKAEVSGSKEDQADGDWKFGTFKPLYMFGQSAAVWIHFSKDEPPKLPDFSPVFEGLMLERFPRHCERVDLLDGKEALPEFLRGCAYLWRPTTLCARDKHGNCLAALGYPEKHIFNTRLGTIDPPSPENNSGNDSTFRIEYLRRAPSASEAFAFLKNEGKRDIVCFHALDLPDNHVRVFPKLESIVWEVPDMVLEDVIETVNGEKQIKKAFKGQLERASRSLSEGLGILDRRIEETNAAATGVRADLAASFSHQYVKQAESLKNQARRIVESVASPAADPNEMQNTRQGFQFQMDVYKREMEIFSEVSKSTFRFGDAELDTSSNVSMPILLPFLRGTLLAFIVSGYTDFDDVFDQLVSGNLRATDLLGGLLEGDSPNDYIITEACEALSKLPYPNVSFAPPIDTLLKVRLWQPGDDKGRGRNLTPRVLFQNALEKIFFEIAYNAVRNWGYTTRLLDEKALPDRCIKVLVDKPEDGAIVLRVDNSSFYPATTATVTPRDFESWLNEQTNKEYSPPRPHKTGGIGGWGLYGNVLLAKMLNRTGHDEDDGGDFTIERVVDLERVPEDPEPPKAFPYTFRSRLYLPRTYLAQQW